MATRKGRKISGGRYITRRKKKSYEIAGQKRIVKIGEDTKKTKRIRGGRKKIFLIKSKKINVNGKVFEIKNVLETPSNRFLARQNILTKGTIVETDAGKVRITNRPTQEGMVNGILVK
jgi:small subunit ribosomal protein S8e